MPLRSPEAPPAGPPRAPPAPPPSAGYIFRKISSIYMFHRRVARRLHSIYIRRREKLALTFVRGDFVIRCRLLPYLVYTVCCLRSTVHHHAFRFLLLFCYRVTLYLVWYLVYLSSFPAAHCPGAAHCNPESAALVASHTITVRAYASTASGWGQRRTQPEAQALT